MAVTKEKKEEVLNELSKLFENAKSIVFAEYKGLSVKDMRNLRKRMQSSDVTYKVAKKTLIKLAAEQAGFKDIPDSILEGQVGAAFGMNDEIAAAKTLYEFSKTNEHIRLLGAFMEGRTLSQAEALELAKIPGKEELLAKLVGSLKSPISGFHGILASLLRNFVGVIGAYKDKLEKEAPAAAEEKPEAPKEVVSEPAPEAQAEETPKEQAAEASIEEAPAEKAEETPKDSPADAPEEKASESQPAPAPEAPQEAPAEESTEEKQ